ncbi:hypothetical protein BpHYR1_006103 [Brachionus plicatilis]|uniref:Uncharacterized protein n=1 Tax=Brachionus plicatilis TaxID=10195 RepID=A0A3M7S7M4_BRAPC|nr:hypothetical protein BpHYR1_006103 [Brachionus plicatilis]
MESPTDIQMNIIEALCPICRNLKSLIACFHCKQPICTDCVSSHVVQWKESSAKFCEITLHDFEKYIKKINLISPIILKNGENIKDIKMKIEENFQKFLKKLIKQKQELFEQIDEIHKENKKFLDFENKVLNSKKSLENFQNALNNNDSDELENLLVDFQEFQEKVDTVSTDYSVLRNQPLKIIGEYEEPNDSEQNFFGNIIVTDSDLLPPKESKHRKSHTKLNESLQKSDNDKIQMFGTLRIKLKRLVEQNDLKSITKKPLEELEVPIQPKFIRANSKNVFISDQNGNLVVIELSKTLVIKSSVKLKVDNIKGFAVNKSYIALSFDELNEDQIQKLAKVYRNFNLKSGIFIFKISDFSLDKVISSSKNYILTSPNGIAMNENNVFVCEKESHSLMKIDLKKASLSNQLIVKGEPTSLNIGDKFLVYVDSKNMEIILTDSDKLTKLRSLKIPQDFFNQLYDLVVRDKVYVAVKNRDDDQEMSTEGFCLRCKNNARLERIGDEILCKPCLIFKYEKYRDECMPHCNRLEVVLASYKNEIDNLHSQISENLTNANRVAEAIERTYANQLKLMNDEKKRLLALVEEGRRDYSKFSDFINQLDRISHDINEFKNPSQNM